MASISGYGMVDMATYSICLFVFVCAYLISMTYLTAYRKKSTNDRVDLFEYPQCTLRIQQLSCSTQHINGTYTHTRHQWHQYSHNVFGRFLIHSSHHHVHT